MWVTRVHGAGFDLGYTVRDPASVGEQVYATAETGLALYDFASARPRRLAPEARAQLAVHIGDPVRFRWGGR
jgi:acyl-CoA thioester hydrolase